MPQVCPLDGSGQGAGAAGATQLIGLSFTAGQAEDGGRRQGVFPLKRPQLGDEAHEVVFRQVTVQDDQRSGSLCVHGQRLAGAAGFAQLVGQFIQVIGQ